MKFLLPFIYFIPLLEMNHFPLHNECITLGGIVMNIWHNNRVKKGLLKIVLFSLLMLVLVACSNDNQGNEDELIANANEEENVIADDDGGSEKSPFDQTGEDIELPSVIPSDVPLPDDAEVTAYGDEEDQGSINISTSMALADLEALYDDYFNEHPQSDEVEKDFYEEEDHDLLSYTTGNDDHLFLIMVTDYGDLVTVHIRYLIY